MTWGWGLLIGAAGMAAILGGLYWWQKCRRRAPLSASADELISAHLSDVERQAEERVTNAANRAERAVSDEKTGITEEVNHGDPDTLADYLNSGRG